MIVYDTVNEDYRWMNKPHVEEIKFETLFFVFPNYCLNLPLY